MIVDGKPSLVASADRWDSVPVDSHALSLVAGSKYADLLNEQQVRGAAFLLSHKCGGAVLADKMGLGKTRQVLCALLTDPNEPNALFVTPPGLRQVWADEMKKIDPQMEVYLPKGSPFDLSADEIFSHRFVAVPYTRAHQWARFFEVNGRGERFHTMVLDEIHELRNYTPPKALQVSGKRIEACEGVKCGEMIINRGGEWVVYGGGKRRLAEAICVGSKDRDVPDAEEKRSEILEIVGKIAGKKDVVVVSPQRAGRFWKEIEGIEVVSYAEFDAGFSTVTETYHQTIVFDEDVGKSHKAVATVALSQYADRVFGLTGTLITNRSADLFPILFATRCPGLTAYWSAFPNGKAYQNLAAAYNRLYYPFTKTYCNGQTKEFWKGGVKRQTYSADGNTNTEKIKKAFSSHILRRDVVANLPEKKNSLLKLDISEDAEWFPKYRRAWQEYIRAYREQELKNKRTGGGDTLEERKLRQKIDNIFACRSLSQTTLLRKLVSSFKMRTAVDMALKNGENGEKTIVFFAYSEPLKAAKKQLGEKAVVYEGASSETERVEAVKKFQEDSSVSVFLANIDAAKTGINLQAATNIIFVDYIWSPEDMKQASARAHRKGQTKVVKATGLHVVLPPLENGDPQESIDDQMYAVLKTKDKISRTIYAEESGMNPSREGR